MRSANGDSSLNFTLELSLTLGVVTDFKSQQGFNCQSGEIKLKKISDLDHHRCTRHANPAALTVFIAMLPLMLPGVTPYSTAAPATAPRHWAAM